jgi:acrylyl-CoA reductase (NADPH)
MIPPKFPAYYVARDSTNQIHGNLRDISLSDLPQGEVLIQAKWTSLNYKDALAATGHPGVARQLPHVPGIDVAGVVAEVAGPSSTSPLTIGDEVLVTGFELGAGQWGGWSGYVRVPREWVIRLPSQMTLREAMVLGTAGFTAAQCVDSLQHHGIEPNSGPVVVTGSTGGVGCIGVMLLAKLGYHVAAVTGKQSLHERLRDWGAADILAREDVLDSSTRPLLSGRWAGALDTVGGNTLATLIRQTRDHGCVTACGLVGGTDLALSVYPFILRGVTLAGITSAGCPRSKRIELWEKLARPWRLPQLDSITTEITLDQVGSLVPKILAGEVVGRTVIRV